jgi:Right handed beta helix region
MNLIAVKSNFNQAKFSAKLGCGQVFRTLRKHPNAASIGMAITIAFMISVGFASSAKSQMTDSIRVIVNSNQDIVFKDSVITLREAILLVNGQMKIEDLSDGEKAQVSRSIMSAENYKGLPVSRIEFQLPKDQTTIRLQKVLPSITKTGLVIDGTNSFNIANSVTGFTVTATEENRGVDAPTIALIPDASLSTPKSDNPDGKNKHGDELDRGITITSSGVTVKNLAIAGFTTRHRSTSTEPPADIFITATSNLDANLATLETDRVPQDIIIENNWLGRLPQGTQTPMKSAFGVYIFNGNQVTIRGNTIADHDGSGIITSIQSQQFKIHNNLIEKNGFAGMPDALRIEGDIAGGEIYQNQIENNAGSGLYVFNPKGSVKIYQNQILTNSQRYRRGAIYLTGLNHDVHDNQITQQSGAGIVVAAYPASYGNQILNNQFTSIQGLPIDLVSQMNVGSNDYQYGDGTNTKTDSRERGEKTGNAGINTPTFISSEFFISELDGSVELSGTTLPNADVEIYKVSGTSDMTLNTLNSATRIAAVKSGVDDRFSIKLTGLKPGDRLAATVSTANFGTSEMTRPVLVKALPGGQVPVAPAPAPVTPSVVEELPELIIVPVPVKSTPPLPQLW